MCVTCFETVIYLITICYFILIEENKVNPALHIYSGEQIIRTKIWKLKEF